MQRLDDDHYKLSTGRTFHAVLNTIGIDEDGRVHHGSMEMSATTTPTTTAMIRSLDGHRRNAPNLLTR